MSTRATVVWATATMSTLSIAIAVHLSAGCTPLSDDCANSKTCPPPDGAVLDDGQVIGPEAEAGGHIDGGGGSDAANGGDADGAVACPPTATPATNACAISDALAIFVAPTGSDSSGTGTKESPVATITNGLLLAQTSGLARVIVCASSYAEQVSVTSGIAIFGGVTCPGAATPWTYNSNTPTIVAPTAHGYALAIANVSAAVDIEDIAFNAQSGTAAGESSIAGSIVASPNVTLRRVDFMAGAGVTGATGVLSDVTFPSAGELQGDAGTAIGGGEGCSFVCPGQPGTSTPGGTTSGGNGGNGGPPSGSGDDGTAGTPALDGGAGQTFAQCQSGTGGPFPGAPAPAASDGAGATALGSLSAMNAWVPAAGATGALGGPGQGGGGGGGSTTGGGGGGGCGGCGGAGGGAGGGGGASVALLVIGSASTIILDTCQLTATTAGAGGAGAAGQPGQAPGGAGGFPSGVACLGGRGGAGGAGGGGGAGGVSAGLFYQGTPPTLTNTTPTAATSPASGGAGGGSSNGGINGQAGAQVSIP